MAVGSYWRQQQQKKSRTTFSPNDHWDVRWKHVGCVWQLVERKSSDFKWGRATVTPAMPHGLLGSWKVALILQIPRQRGRPTLTGGEKGKSKWALMSARLATADSSDWSITAHNLYAYLTSSCISYIWGVQHHADHFRCFKLWACSICIWSMCTYWQYKMVWLCDSKIILKIHKTINWWPTQCNMHILGARCT